MVFFDFPVMNVAHDFRIHETRFLVPVTGTTNHVIVYTVAVENKSPLPLANPRDTVPRAHHVVHRFRRSV